MRRDAEPVRQHLREGRLVSLSGRLRAGVHVHRAVAHRRPARARAARRPAPRHSSRCRCRRACRACAPRACARLAPCQSASAAACAHVAAEIAAVVGEAHRGAIGQLRAADQIAPPDLQPVDAEPRRRHVDQPLQHEMRLRPSGAAIGRGRHRVGEGRADARMRGRDVVHGRHDAVAVVQRHIRHRMRARIAEHLDRECEDAPGAVEREPRRGDEIAALQIGEEAFGAVAGPAHRPPDMARRPHHHDLLGIDIGAQPERAADIGADHAHALRRDAEAFGERGLLAMHALAAGDQRVAVVRRIVCAERGARLHLGIDDALIAERVLDDDLGRGECRARSRRDRRIRPRAR